MKLNVKAFTLAAGILWGGAILIIAAGNLIWPDYGQAFLEWTASVYPGYTPSAGGASVVIGTLYGFVDAAVAGLIFAWLYNLMAK